MTNTILENGSIGPITKPSAESIIRMSKDIKELESSDPVAEYKALNEQLKEIERRE